MDGTTGGEAMVTHKGLQVPLFDGFPRPVLKRLPKSSAHNAKKHRNGRLILAGGWVVDGQNRVLLLHRKTPNLTQWETPGGKVDYGEAPAEAAVRELAKELGVDAVVVDDLGWHDFEAGPNQMRYALFRMEIAGGEPHPVESDKFDAVQFFPLSDLYDMQNELSPNALNLLALYCEGLLDLTAGNDEIEPSRDAVDLGSNRAHNRDESREAEPRGRAS